MKGWILVLPAVVAVVAWGGLYRGSADAAARLDRVVGDHVLSRLAAILVAPRPDARLYPVAAQDRRDAAVLEWLGPLPKRQEAVRLYDDLAALHEAHGGIVCSVGLAGLDSVCQAVPGGSGDDSLAGTAIALCRVADNRTGAFAELAPCAGDADGLHFVYVVGSDGRPDLGARRAACLRQACRYIGW